MTRLASKAERPLSFDLTVLPARVRERFGVELEEVGGSNGTPPLRVRLDPSTTAQVITSILDALRDSKVKPGQLSPRRERPLRLSEPSGVRLALVMMGAAPLSRRERIAQVAEGVESMSTEEAYYWYAKCTGRGASRARRALRLMLSDE